jgi:O-antigen/teichoic acid export membrane protein
VLAALVTARLLGYDGDTLTMIWIATAVMVLDSVHLIFYAVMRGFQDLRFEAVGVITGQVVTIAAGGLFIFGLRLPLPFLIVALLMGSVWNVIWSSWSVMRRFPVRVSFRLDRPIVRHLAAVTLPFALAGVFTRVYSYLDSVMLSRLASDAELGAYGVAYKLTFAFIFLPMSFAAAVYPAMSEYYVSDRKRLGTVFSTALKYLYLVVAPLACGIAVLARPLVLMVYGPDFAGAIVPLQILIFSLIFAFLYWPAGSLLNACDRQGRNTVILGVTMVSNLLLNVWLIPRHGAVGAAVAALVGNFVLWAGAMRAAEGVAAYDLPGLLRTAAKVTFAATFMGTSVHLLQPFTPLLALIPAGALIYALVLLGVGGVTPGEAKALMDAFLRRGGRKISDLMSDQDIA